MTPKTAILALGLSILSSCGASAACNAVVEAQNAAASGDIALGRSAVAHAAEDGSCTGQERQLTVRYLSVASFNAIVEQVALGKPLADFEAELDRVRLEGGTWQVYDALADINRARGDYETAHEYYTVALQDASDETLTPDWMAPDEAYIRHMDKAATEMRLAAKQAPLLSTRAGGCRLSYRSVVITQKTLPIRFVFGKSEFTPEGEESAADLLKCLKLNDAKSVTLTGHTDPVGGRAYNQTLSEQRAGAVAHYLTANGFAGKILTQGRGEGEPFKVDDRSAYDEETLHQIFRRVEVEVQ